MVRRFFNQAIMSYKSLFGMLTLENYIFVKTLMPILQLVFFVLTAKFAYHANDVTQWVIGNALILASFNAFFGVSMTFISDRYMGTLKVVMSSPMNKFSIFIGRTLMHIADGFLSVISGLLIGVLLFNVNLSSINFPLFILTIIIGVFSVMSLGVLIGIFALITREIYMLTNICYSLMLILSGANIPRESLPIWLNHLSQIIPLTRSVEASKLLLVGNTNVTWLLIEELLLGCSYIIIALCFYKFIERIARVYGTLDAY
ncbi:ABC transporter permease [Mycoplasmatota bacterium]|nr:ABC transporter permease [Mycoplasmatota bacterium]